MQMLKTTAGKLLAVVLKILWIRREIILHLQLHSKAKTQNWQVENDCQFQFFFILGSHKDAIETAFI
jgi:hypothetical protein